MFLNIQMNLPYYISGSRCIDLELHWKSRSTTIVYHVEIANAKFKLLTIVPRCLGLQSIRRSTRRPEYEQYNTMRLGFRYG